MKPTRLAIAILVLVGLAMLSRMFSGESHAASPTMSGQIVP
ncbi:MAG TPA: hypothetical protein VHM90_14745 [Phycisphaerae bacterium]|jgi:hypothetical protein|nr:hypothetical protein [Phycisphaerae bacterium]